MPFEPTAGMSLGIAGAKYRVSEHPVKNGEPYGRQGSTGMVYQLAVGPDRRALKVFPPAFREPARAEAAQRMAPYAVTAGMRACERTVLTVQQHPVLLQEHADLAYAVLMPWIEGVTWAEQMADPRGLTIGQSAAVAGRFAQLLAGLEEQGLAHCDLSGSNILLSLAVGRPGVELVDVEQMFAPGLLPPSTAPVGSPGYSHLRAHMGVWSPEADRFAGAVLLGEILGWCDSRVRQAAWGESYFDPSEMQRDCARSRLLAAALQSRWGERVSRLFAWAWRSAALHDCPPFGEWSSALAAMAGGDDTTQGRSPVLPILPAPKRLAAAMRRQEGRLARVQPLHTGADGGIVADLCSAVRHLCDKLEDSFPPAAALRGNPRYGDFVLQVDLFCQEMTAVMGGTADSVRVREAKYLADALRAEAGVLVRTLRRG